MSNPQIRDGFDLTAPTPELHLTWERGTGKGADLPDSYFDWVHPSLLGSAREVIQSVKHIAPREIVIQLAREELLRNLERSRQLELVLEFPDRRIAIDCTHPASADAYIVSIKLEFHEQMLLHTKVEQSVYLGPY